MTAIHTITHPKMNYNVSLQVMEHYCSSPYLCDVRHLGVGGFSFNEDVPNVQRARVCVRVRVRLCVPGQFVVAQ